MLSLSIYQLQCAFFVILLFSVIDIGATQGVCGLPYAGPHVVTSVLVVKQTIHVMTHIPKDTAFEVNPYLTISVDNAPTDLDVTTTYHSRSTSVVTIPGYFSSYTPRQVSTENRNGTTTGLLKHRGDQFTLRVAANHLSSKRRRQADSFVSYNGRTTTSCTQASILTIYNGQLFITYANGTVAQFSANAGDAYDSFLPSTTPGNTATTFSLSNAGTLLWNNPSFFNGNALFCLLPSGEIIAVFQQGAQPTSCVFIDLTIVECR